MRKFYIFPVTLVLIALAVAAFLLLPRSGGEFLLEPIVDAPHSVMPVPEDAPVQADDVPAPAPMGDVDEALSAAPAPTASVMPVAPAPMTSAEKGKLGEDRWILSWMGDEAVPKGDRAPNIVFDMQESHVSGYAGCNRFSGAFDLEGNALSFGPIAATKMACDQLALESAYLSALDAVSGWSLVDGVLILTDGQGADVARFIRP